jgi:hypothetical protein
LVRGPRGRLRARALLVVSGLGLAVVVAGCGGGQSPEKAGARSSTSVGVHAATTSTSPPSGTTSTSNAGTSATEPVDNQISVYGNCTNPSVEPSEVVLTCADYGVLVEDIHWTSWTASSAAGEGTLVYNTCMPYCAAGRHISVPGTRITLTGPVLGASGQLVWSMVQESPQPPGYETGPFHGGPQPIATKPV